MTSRRPRRGPLLAWAIAAGAALALGAYLAWGPRRADRGATVGVWVEVVDEAGEPVTSARVRARYDDSLAVRVDRRGRARLGAVPLRPQQSASPAAVAEALVVGAPFHALRRGTRPRVEVRDGGWHARFVLEACGIVRLGVRPSPHGAGRAWIVTRGTGGGVQPVGPLEVARPGQRVAWHVFPEVERVQVRLEGPSGVAARRYLLDAPDPGFVVERDLEVEEARPVRGRFVVPAAWQPPEVAGRVEVTEVRDGEEIPYDAVRVADDAAFRIPFTGSGRYRLRAVLGFLEAPADLTVEGGAEVEWEGLRPRPWFVLDASGWGPLGEGARLLLWDRETDGRVRVPYGVVTKEGRVYAALPRPGRYRLEVRIAGTARAPPREGSSEGEATGPGPHPLDLEVAEVPWGEVVLAATGPLAASGGTATLLAPESRRATLLPELGEEASFAHVPAGAVWMEVRWRHPDAARVFLAGDLAPGRTLRVEVAAVSGGRVRVRFRGGAGAGGGDLLLAWPAGGSPYGAAPGEVRLVRRGSEPHWTGADPLRPGSYRAAWRPAAAPAGDGREVVFEVVAGEVTLVEVDGS